jgi:hypothetical protein
MFNKSAFWDPSKVPNEPHPNDPNIRAGEKLEGKITGFTDCGTPGKSQQTDMTLAHDNSARFTFDLMTVDSVSDDIWGDENNRKAQSNYRYNSDNNSEFTGCVGLYGYAYWNGIGPSNESARVPPMFLGLLPINQEHDLKIKVTKSHPSLRPLKYTIHKIFPDDISLSQLSCGNGCEKGNSVQFDIDRNGFNEFCTIHEVSKTRFNVSAKLKCYVDVSENFDTQYEFYINDRLVGRLPRGKNIKAPQKCQKALLRPYFGGDDAWTVGKNMSVPEVYSCLSIPGNGAAFNKKTFDIFIKKAK